MSKHGWKNVERQICRWFGCERTPLSGGNSGHTRADCLHDDLFIEVKHHKKFAIWSLWEKVKELAKKENKTPIVALKQNGKQGFLIVMHVNDIDEFVKWYNNVYNRYSDSSHFLQHNINKSNNTNNLTKE